MKLLQMEEPACRDVVDAAAVVAVVDVADGEIPGNRLIRLDENVSWVILCL